MSKICHIIFKVFVFRLSSWTGYGHSDSSRGCLDEAVVGCLVTAVTVDDVTPVIAGGAGLTTARAG